MAKILLQYEADTKQLAAELKKVETANKKVDDSSKKTGASLTDSFTKAGKSVEGASQKTNLFSSALNNAKSAASGYGNIFSQIATGIGAAFAVERVIAFADASLKAFREAELNARKLQVAVSVNGGLSTDFDNLIDQSEQLQKITIFSDDDIQRAQTVALQYGLTADQVEKLIPVITDYASATGDTLTGALNNVIGGLEGNARALKKQGVVLVENADTTTQLANITDQLNTKFKNQAEIIAETSEGSAKKLANQFDDIKESVGEFISGFTDATATILSFVLNGLEPLNDGLGESESRLKLTREELDKFGNSVVNAQINILQSQIDRLSASGQDVSKLNDQLSKLKDQQFNIEINGLSNEELQSKIKALESIQFKTKETSDQLNKLKEEAKNRNLELIVSEKDLTSLTATELEKRKKLIEDASKKTNSATLRDALEAINKELEARKKINQSAIDSRAKGYEDLLALQKDFEQKSLESAAKTEADKLEVQRKALIDKAKEAFKTAGGSFQGDTAVGSTKVVEAFLKAQAAINATYDELINNAKIKAAEETAKEIAKINKENLSEDLKATLQTIEDSNEKQKQLRIKQFIEAGDFTKQSYQQLNDDLLLIDQDTFNKQNEERVKSGEEAKSNEKDITDNLLDEADKRVEATASEEERKRELRLQTVQAIQDDLSQLSDALSTFRDNEIEQIEQSRDAQLAAYDEQLSALESLNERGAYSDRVYEAKKKELLDKRLQAEKKADAELRKLKKEQAEQDKLKAIFDIIVNTSVAVSKLLATPFLAIAAGAAGALELAKVISTPIPKFFKGKSFVERGNNPPGIDTIPAYLNEGERIVTTENNRKHWDIYEAIENNEFKKFVQKHYVIPQLKAYKNEVEKRNQKDFAGNIASALISSQGGLTFYEADRIRKKGMTINNTKELAQLIGEVVASNTPKYYGRW